MKPAETILDELILYVRPPRGCAIRLTERRPDGSIASNWHANIGLGARLRELGLFNEKYAELRKSDPIIDWSEINPSGGHRHIARWVSEVEAVSA